jgi:integrase
MRQGFLEHSEYLQVRNALPDHLRAIFVVAYHAGMRLGELRKIQWPQIDLVAGEKRSPGRFRSTAICALGSSGKNPSAIRSGRLAPGFSTTTISLSAAT